MRVLSLLVLFAVAAQSVTIYNALRSSKQFSYIVDIVDRVPELQQILDDPDEEVTFFAPSNNALTNVPFSKPFRYLFPGIFTVSTMEAGDKFNYRGETISFAMDKSHYGLRTEHVFLPGTSDDSRARILRAPLRKENKLLENGNLYYMDNQIFQCGEIEYYQCQTVTRCSKRCGQAFPEIEGRDVVETPRLDIHFAPPPNLPRLSSSKVNGYGPDGSVPLAAPAIDVGAGLSDFPKPKGNFDEARESDSIAYSTYALNGVYDYGEDSYYYGQNYGR